jgi:quercetin dioxygenase-like cupin family protein
MKTSQATHVRWGDLPREQVGERIERRYVTGVHLTLAQFHLAKGCLVPTHEHESEQFVNVVAG